MLPPNLPPISNRALYVYRVTIKWISFFIFGSCSLILGALILPPMRLLLHPRDKFSKYARHLVSFAMGWYIAFMHAMQCVNLEVEDRDFFKNLSSKIVIANHPSILDVVMLLSLIPNADCIVSAYLSRSIIGGVIRQLYILNSLDFSDLLKSCSESLNQGNCLIIFPEGTRTPRTGNVKIKKGTARIALASGRDIIPLHIGGTDKYGLGKKDPWLAFNPTGRYIYRISVEPAIHMTHYRDFSAPVAARTLTRDIAASLFPPEQQ